MVKSRKIETYLWDMIRLELYYLDGGCQHSGNCCKHLMLYKQEKPIKNHRDFQALKTENPSYRRFIPQGDPPQITSFTCSCLQPNNWCNDYDNRPTVCRNYPLSNFILGDELYSGCGYRISRTVIQPPQNNKRLHALMTEYELKVAV